MRCNPKPFLVGDNINNMCNWRLNPVDQQRKSQNQARTYTKAVQTLTWKTRQSRESQETPKGEEIAMETETESQIQNTEFDFFLLGWCHPSDPAHVQIYILKYNQTFIKFSHSVGPCHFIVKFH